MKKDFLVASVLSALYFVVLSLMLLEVRIHSLLEKLPYFYVKKKKIALSSASLRTLSSSFQLNSFPHHPDELAIFPLYLRIIFPKNVTNDISFVALNILVSPLPQSPTVIRSIKTSFVCDNTHQL